MRVSRWILGRLRKMGWAVPEWLDEKVLQRILLAFGCSSVLAVAAGIYILFMGREEVIRIQRPVYGEGSFQESLEMEWTDENGSRETKEMIVEIKEKALTEEEEVKVIQEVQTQLEKVMLGENASADMVNQPLNLPEKLEGYPVTISWISSDPSCVDWEGQLKQEIPPQGKQVCLEATLSVQDREETCRWYVTVFPPELSEEEQLQKLMEQENNRDTEEWYYLPAVWNGSRLTWKKNNNETILGVVFLALIFPVLLVMRERQSAAEKKKKERQQMLQDYPEILCKLTLLLGAGVNLRKAIWRIGNDYEKYVKPKEVRKAYEILVDACHEMDRGLGEREVYARMGEKMGLLPYRTLSALLIQHLQKGSRGMEHLLEEEAAKAQEMRRQQARVLGEQASTRLLFPMILMLVVVFVLMLVPAWISFSG